MKTTADGIASLGYLSMYDTKCNNGIVGLFCAGYGCYYNSDCYDGYCNMYSKCARKGKHPMMADLEKQLSNAVDSLQTNNGTATTAEDTAAKNVTSDKSVDPSTT